MTAARRVLFVHNYPMRFVTVDLALLREPYSVTELQLNARRMNPVSILTHVRRHDIVFAWFASLHSFIPLLFARLLGRPSLLVVGGYDVAYLPEVGYGYQPGILRRLIARSAMRLATRLVANSHYSREEAIRNAGADPGKITVIHHGFDPCSFRAGECKEALAVTIGNVNRENLVRKGLEAFVLAARSLPEVSHVLIGRLFDDAAEHLRNLAPPNVTFTGYLPDRAVEEILRRAKVYVQASAHEGFGMAVAEAMLCGCVPVVTRAGALPEVVGDAGVYLASRDPREVADGVRQALGWNGEQRRRARERIVHKFPLEKRRQGLFGLVDGLPAARAA